MTTPEPKGSQPPGGKGRPTPRRREQEARNHRPVVAAPRKKVAITGATKAERKEQRAAAREETRQARMVARERMMAGDERYLNERDKGPARRWARDYVDARRNVAEFFLPFTLVFILMSVSRIGVLVVASAFLLYGFVLVAAVDVFLLRRKVARLTAEKFGEAKAAGVGGYAMMRALQMRRTRIPKPQVQRGQFPS